MITERDVILKEIDKIIKGNRNSETLHWNVKNVVISVRSKKKLFSTLLDLKTASLQIMPGSTMSEIWINARDAAGNA